MNQKPSLPALRVPLDSGSSLTGASPIFLESHWPPTAQSTKTTVRLYWKPDALFVCAEMEDEEVTTRATEDSQMMCSLGDVFEVFLEAKDAGFYTEMHIAPGNHRLHLRFVPGDIELVRDKKLTLGERTLRPPQFESRTVLHPGGWTVDLRIPVGLVDPKGVITPETQWNASFCRYDVWTDGRPAVLSSTSAHEVANYHLRKDWRPICF
ncbi:MAG: hypothetical protein IAE94_11905 [Chthoniobacterales bacterium]|nr:hypothetical protein [Chthoniobacterales bacterium]